MAATMECEVAMAPPPPTPGAVMMCVECEDTEAGVRCDTCDDVYCILCYEAQHHAGTRRGHTKVVLEVAAPPPPPPPPQVLKNDAAATNATPSNNSEQKQPMAAPATAVASVTSDDEGSSADEEEEPSTTPRLAALMKEAKFIPMRLSDEERALFLLLDSALTVSEYTDKVDVLSYRSPAKRIVHELQEIFSTLSGMMVVNDFRRGKRLIQQKKFQQNEEFFQQVFEIGRRYKIMNPERMRDNYGKMIYLLQDANLREIRSHLGFSCVGPINTVHAFLEERDALEMLRDPLCITATAVVSGSGDSAAKTAAIEELATTYSSNKITPDEIKRCLASIGDKESFLDANLSPIIRMIRYLQEFFKPDQAESPYSLEIRSGRDGARLSHSHGTQYEYVLQSLLLWRNITGSMLRLWWAVEDDLLSGAMYRLRDTGQGLNRVQHAPDTSRLVHAILHQTQKSRARWVGSSVVHLGDHNVPNALMFIDKYTQISRILSPIVNTVAEVEGLAQHPDTRTYIEDAFGGARNLQRQILCDFFKHGFDGSGADNFFDAGSCIDGRLTSAWNWCSKIEKKPFFHVFLMAGFVGFDGHFEK
ncbi:TPA: hypothetical protein N0F65_006373 [Lagenidium giganteum]|uniref:B box-type domain-containing protein n=1 Tax=Lagenidium giganteum TaxID=4803 RepID=A0AAV2YX17_9STRA|nr:TPA: hypothetical protein N0F65_006373 [Lagenidium giganteum]